MINLKENKVRTKNKKNNYDIFDKSMDKLIQILTYAAAAVLFLLPFLFIHLNSLQFHYFIDEKFHIPQTLKYCNGEFLEWDPKITTLPGLYVLTALILGPFGYCTITNLRFINLMCTYFNLFLAYKLVSVANEKDKSTPARDMKNYYLFLRAWNIVFFPPLFFWFFLYYTDIFSVTLILIMLLFHVHNRNNVAAFMGALSIGVRQTNVIWVAYLGIERGLTLIEEITHKPHFTNTLNLLPCIKTLYKIFSNRAKLGIFYLFKYITNEFKPVFPYLLVLISFVGFVIYNGSIVVGDRTAHVPTIHLTQVLYYSVFVFGFSWPYLLPYLNQFLQFLYKNLMISSILLCFITLIVHYNTLVHPYILADNRHYSFYIWKNFMNRYYIFKYLLIPIYAFAIYAILKSLSNLRLLSIVAYTVCISAVLIPQLLLEPRYFIIPYILFRLHIKEQKTWQLIAESLTTFFINFVQFFIFANKTFMWKDEEYPQRIGW